MAERERRNLLPGKLLVAVKKDKVIPTTKDRRVERRAKVKVRPATFTTQGEKTKDTTESEAPSPIRREKSHASTKSATKLRNKNPPLAVAITCTPREQSRLKRLLLNSISCIFLLQSP
jgi:hypothetical protein